MNILFLIIIGKQFAEAFESQYSGRQLLATHAGFEIRRGASHEAKPQITGKSGAGIGRVVLLVVFANGFDRRALLVLHAITKLSAERTPIFGANIGFKAGSQQRTHGREHRLTGIHGDVRGWGYASLLRLSGRRGRSRIDRLRPAGWSGQE